MCAVLCIGVGKNKYKYGGTTNQCLNSVQDWMRRSCNVSPDLSHSIQVDGSFWKLQAKPSVDRVNGHHPNDSDNVPLWM